MEYIKIGGRNPIDPRLANKISRSPTMMREQGSSFMGDYGGVDNYVTFAKLPANDRLVLAAQMDGVTNPDEIAIVTGLSVAQVNKVIGVDTTFEVVK